MRYLLSLALLIGTALSCSAADISLPKEAKGEVGDFITIRSTTSPGCIVKWIALDPGLKVFPTDLLRDTHTAVVIGSTAGTYRLLAYTGDKDGPSDPVICLVTVGTPGPPPPPPPPPAPNDPFFPTLTGAWYQEPGSKEDRVAATQKLAEIYKQAAANTVNRADLSTCADVQNTMHVAIQKLIGDSLTETRKAIALELQTKLPRDPTKNLDAATRALYTEQFARLARLLEALK